IYVIKDCIPDVCVFSISLENEFKNVFISSELPLSWRAQATPGRGATLDGSRELQPTVWLLGAFQVNTSGDY
ncbi:MAG: hypothetical protein ACOYM3_25145, partial [Terrimicrobiaceae bacterium]